jgi:hypothetical protein
MRPEDLSLDIALSDSIPAPRYRRLLSKPAKLFQHQCHETLHREDGGILAQVVRPASSSGKVEVLARKTGATEGVSS